MYDYRPARMRRLLAFIVDMNLFTLQIFLLMGLLMLIPEDGLVFVLGITVFIGLASLHCRDWLLSGRSIGKRLLGLSVVDRATGGPATGKQLFRKGLCFMALPFDAFLLMLTGRSLGERISDTAVIRRKVPAPMVPKRFYNLIAVALVAGLLLGFGISLGLNAAKENESYARSLDYLADTMLITEEPQLTGFSSSTHGTQHTHSYTFIIDGSAVTVTCHPLPDGSWAVCTECTEFD